MSSPSIEYLRHMLAEAEYIVKESADIQLAEFLDDETLSELLSAVSKSSAKPQNMSLLSCGTAIQNSNGAAWLACAIA